MIINLQVTNAVNLVFIRQLHRTTILYLKWKEIVSNEKKSANSGMSRINHNFNLNSSEKKNKTLIPENRSTHKVWGQIAS